MEHKKLKVWKRAVDFVINIYQMTDAFPKNEEFGLKTQIRRAAVSIPSNISEGAARQSDKETIQFLYISLGSIAELETQIIISSRLNFISSPDLVLEELTEIKMMTLGLIKHLKSKCYP